MSKELSQNQLERLVVGTPPDPNVTFFEKPVLNMAESKRQNRRVYEKAVFVKITNPGVTDWTAYRATDKDIRDYPEAYEYFMNNRQGQNAPGVEIIPNLDITHLQELIDNGLTTIPVLAAAQMVPPHLQYAQDAAIALNNTLQEMNHAEEEDSKEESEGRSNAPSGRIDTDDIRQPELPRSGRNESDQVAQRVQAGGCQHGSQGINNWEVEFVWRP
jgi:hypothetical protein